MAAPLVARVWRRAALAATVAGMMAAVPSITLAGDWTYFPQQRVLEHSRQYTVQGVRTERGCEFADEELILPKGWEEIERRDIALDLNGCRKLVEEGRPKESAPRASSAGRSFSVTGDGGAPLAPTTWNVKATGYSNGQIGGSNSTDVVNECLPLSKHSRTVIAASGNGGP